MSGAAAVGGAASARAAPPAHPSGKPPLQPGAGLRRHCHPRLFHPWKITPVGSTPRFADMHGTTSDAGTGDRGSRTETAAASRVFQDAKRGRAATVGRDAGTALAAAAARPFHLKSSWPFKGRGRRPGAAAPPPPCRGRCRPAFGGGGGGGWWIRGWRGGPSAAASLRPAPAAAAEPAPPAPPPLFPRRPGERCPSPFPPLPGELPPRRAPAQVRGRRLPVERSVPRRASRSGQVAGREWVGSPRRARGWAG